jgi:hypothetical protein
MEENQKLVMEEGFVATRAEKMVQLLLGTFQLSSVAARLRTYLGSGSPHFPQLGSLLPPLTLRLRGSAGTLLPPWGLV